MKLIPTLSAGLILTACSYLPGETMRQLAQLDPMTTDPGSIAVSFRLPEGLDLPKDSVVLTLMAKHNTGEEANETYVLHRGTAGADVVFRIAPSDLDRLRSQQALVNTWDEDNTEGSFAIGIVGGCTTGAGPDMDALFSNAISLDGGFTYLPLITDVPVNEALDEDEIAEMPAC